MDSEDKTMLVGLGIVFGFLSLLVIVLALNATTPNDIAKSCDLQGSFVVSGKAYKCELAGKGA